MSRPDPDALLSLVQREQGRPGRGRLRIYLGANAGVDKTFAMLEWAHSLKRQGTEVLVGLVETHQRADTAALLEGLEVLPRRDVRHRDVVLHEFDLERALERRPGLLILDELAHTNAPGGLHERRWQDVEELLAAGINVVTALNVQHLESLNDLVEQLTGVRVRETVPDHVVEGADEVVLVDVSPQELQQRLREGKVYRGPQATEALERFFRPGNLLALRELALRFVAGRVGAEVEVYRHAEAGQGRPSVEERLLVAVGPSPSSARLIRSTRRLSAALDAPWIALSVRHPERTESPANRARLSENIALAESLGAEVVVAAGADVAEEILRVARARNVTKIVVGKPVHPRWRDWFQRSPVDRIIRESGEIDVSVISGEGGAPGPGFAATPQRRPMAPYGIAVVTVLVVSGISLPLHPWLGLPEIVMLYLAAVSVTAAYASRGAMVLGCVLAVLAFNVLFVPPRYSLQVESYQYLVTFAVMLLAGGLISTLSSRLRGQAAVARDGERRMQIMSRLATRLVASRGAEGILRSALEEVAEAVQTQVVAHLVLPSGSVQFACGHPVNLPPDGKESAVAQWVADHGRLAGRNTDTLGSALLVHLPVAVAGHAPRAVLGIYPPREREPLDALEMQMVQSLCSQTALALQADLLAEEQRRSEAARESERLRSALLGSISHDLRTPITAILGCATSLLEQAGALSEKEQVNLQSTIREQAERMGTLVSNLLEMTRLQDGASHLRLCAIPMEELIGSALAALRPRLGQRAVEMDLAGDLPFVFVDEVLIHIVFLNLLENALTYSPPEQPLRLSARVEGRWVFVEVADRGPGIAPAELGKIFEKFQRGTAAEGKSGAGLGLAIARTIVEAHGGSITASNRGDGGACFTFTLPVADEQPGAIEDH